MATTLYLDPDSWDLAIDASGNIAVATGRYQLAQDAASAIKTFQGEVFYDTSLGIPDFAELFGSLPAPVLLKPVLEAAALTVPGVLTARAFITGTVDRTLVGQVQITDASGATAAASF